MLVRLGSVSYIIWMSASSNKDCTKFSAILEPSTEPMGGPKANTFGSPFLEGGLAYWLIITLDGMPNSWNLVIAVQTFFSYTRSIYVKICYRKLVKNSPKIAPMPKITLQWCSLSQQSQATLEKGHHGLPIYKKRMAINRSHTLRSDINMQGVSL